MSLNFEMRDMSDDYHKIDNSQNLIPPPNKSKLNIKKINSNTKNIIIISALFSYYIYSIMTLHDFSYNHEKKLCKHSHFWLYLLLSLFSNFILIINSLSKCFINEKKSFILIFSNTITFCFKILFIIWYVILLKLINCSHNLKNTSLFNLSLIQFMFDIFLVVSMIINISCIISKTDIIDNNQSSEV